MKKRNAYLISFFSVVLMLFSACSNIENENENVDYAGEVGQIKFDLRFEGTAGGTRAGSNAIPVTSWAKIKQVQFFLYDATGTSKTVRYSVTEDPAHGNKTYTYGDVPTGTYTLVAVANAKSSTDPIETEIRPLGFMEWNNFNVRSKTAPNLTIWHKHRASLFPAYADPGAANTAYDMPAEIFMAEATGVVIKSDSTTVVPAMTLKREVALMRVRINVSDPESTSNNTTGAEGIDWTKNTSVLIYNLPEYIGISAGTDGGVSASSVSTNIMVGATSFETADPNGADYSPTQILDTDFTMWQDIVVFPNNGGRAHNNNYTGNSEGLQRYYIVISAWGEPGHKLGNGETVPTGGATVYWSGLIKGNFVPNIIREVNLTLKSGGSITIPTTPTEEGELTISLGEPAPWNSNIQEESIIL